LKLHGALGVDEKQRPVVPAPSPTPRRLWPRLLLDVEASFFRGALGILVNG
jgi:hypothetical protein